MKATLKELLAQCDITINGEHPWDMQVHDKRCEQQILENPSPGAGEAYMQGQWDCAHLDQFFFQLLRNLNPDTLPHKTQLLWFIIKGKLLNLQSHLRSKEVAKIHYNLDNALYRAMLGESMAYTCGYWKNASTLDEAQYAKFDLICRKLNLQPGERVLDLGCGWGGFSHYAAKHYGCSVVGINIAKEQVRYGMELCKDLPVTFYECDYRDLHIYNPEGVHFDKVASIGLCEHIGYKNYKPFMEIARTNLKEDGLFLLHTIGKNNSFNYTDPWILKYIFPGSIMPSIKLLSQAMEDVFIVEDFHNFGPDYDKTLMAWYDNFCKSWPDFEKKYDQTFYRMWSYYLLSCAGAFRARDLQLWQFVLSPHGELNGYTRIE